MAWGGVPLNARTAAMMDEAQALYGATITATQGSPSTSVGASALTHAGEGVIDVTGADLDAIVVAMRQVGFAAWHRTPAQGFVHHVHGVAVAEPLLHPQAQTQVDSYFAGHNGLRGNGLDDGPRDWVGITWETYSGGTYVPPTGGGVPVTIYGQYPGDRSGTYALNGGVLTGTPTWTVTSGSVPAGTKRFYGLMPGPVAGVDAGNAPGLKLTLDAGDSIALAVEEDWWYYQGGFADLTQGYYMLRVAGTGDLVVADTYDLDYYYPSENPALPWSWNACASAGSDGEFRYYTADPALLDESHLWDDGSPLIRLTCTSGTVEVTYAGMRINQAQGFYDLQLDGVGDPVTTWSSTQPPSEWEPVNNGLGTYAATTVGGTSVWTVDGTPVVHATGRDDWRGNGDTLVGGDAQDALDLANADFHAFTNLAVTETSVNTTHVPAGVDIFGPTPERWFAGVRDAVGVATAPTKSTLPNPAGLADIELWNIEGWEWLETDSHLLGWHFLGQDDEAIYDHFIEVRGDADTARFVVHPHNTNVDLDADFPEPDDGIEIASGTSTDNAPGADRSYLPITDSFLTTTDNMLITQVALARRTTAIADKYTTEFGYPAGNEGTSARVVAVRSTDDTVVAVRHLVARYRVPTWRYASPLFVSSPGPVPVIDFDEDPTVRYLRNRQRNDGLGGWSTPRAKGTSSRQLSLHNRGYE